MSSTRLAVTSVASDFLPRSWPTTWLRDAPYLPIPTYEARQGLHWVLDIYKFTRLALASSQAPGFRILTVDALMTEVKVTRGCAEAFRHLYSWRCIGITATYRFQFGTSNLSMPSWTGLVLELQ